MFLFQASPSKGAGKRFGSVTKDAGKLTSANLLGDEQLPQVGGIDAYHPTDVCKDHLWFICEKSAREGKEKEGIHLASAAAPSNAKFDPAKAVGRGKIAGVQLIPDPSSSSSGAKLFKFYCLMEDKHKPLNFLQYVYTVKPSKMWKCEVGKETKFYGKQLGKMMEDKGCDSKKLVTMSAFLRDSGMPCLVFQIHLGCNSYVYSQQNYGEVLRRRSESAF